MNCCYLYGVYCCIGGFFLDDFFFWGVGIKIFFGSILVIIFFYFIFDSICWNLLVLCVGLGFIIVIFISVICLRGGFFFFDDLLCLLMFVIELGDILLGLVVILIIGDLGILMIGGDCLIGGDILRFN